MTSNNISLLFTLSLPPQAFTHWPYGPIGRFLGAVAVDRSRRTGLTDTLRQYYASGLNPIIRPKNVHQTHPVVSRIFLSLSLFHLPLTGYNIPIVVFSEGNVTNGTAVARLKTGAFAINTPVLPVAVSYQVPSGASAALTAPWIPLNWRSSLRTFFDPIKWVTVEFLPEVRNDGGSAAAEARAHATGKMIADALCVPYREDLCLEDNIRWVDTLRARIKQGQPWIPINAWNRAQPIFRAIEECRRHRSKENDVKRRYGKQ